MFKRNFEKSSNCNLQLYVLYKQSFFNEITSILRFRFAEGRNRKYSVINLAYRKVK